MLLTLFGAVALNVWLIVMIPKSFFPEQDTGRITASLVADQSISFQLMSKKFTQMMAIVQSDPAVEDVVGFTGAGGGGASAQTNTGTVYVSLKPLERARRRGYRDGAAEAQAGPVPGGRLYLSPVQDIRIGGRSGNAEYQYTILGDDTAEVYAWAPKLLAAVQNDPALADVNSDQQQRGLETYVTVDRDTASRLGLTMYQIDNTLYDAFGQRSVSTIYSALNQYHVVMEVAPQYWQRPAMLRQFWVSTSGAQASGSETTQLSAGSVTGGSQLAVATASVASTAAVSQPLSSATASRPIRHSRRQQCGAARQQCGVAGGDELQLGSSSSSTSSAASNNAVRTAAQATITTTGNGSASSAPAVSTSPRQ